MIAATELEFHDAANIFPLDEEHIAELAVDIQKNGQQVPIELIDGKILDGRRRYLACQQVEVEPLTKNVRPSDPVAYVLSLNLHRRQLTPSQRAMIGAKARECYEEQAKERQKLSSGRGQKGPVTVPDLKGDTRDHVGKTVGVGGSLIDRATKVIEQGEPELAKAVEEGRLSVSNAAKLVDRPAEVQKQVAAQAEHSGGRYRNQSVAEKGDAEPTGERRGKGVILANEAVNCLSRIPKNDALRKRGFQIVTDWIKANK